MSVTVFNGFRPVCARVWNKQESHESRYEPPLGSRLGERWGPDNRGVHASIATRVKDYNGVVPNEYYEKGKGGHRGCRGRSDMLAVFEKVIGKPPPEMRIPAGPTENHNKSRIEIAETFGSLWPDSTFYNLRNGNFMALSHANENPLHPWSIVVMDEVFCIFIGTLDNMCDLRRHYGLSRQATEAMLVVEVFRVLRDRAPYPPDQVIKDLSGEFSFVLFDSKYNSLFIARDRDGSVGLQWGMATDESLVCSDDPQIMVAACGKSCAPFPPGCIFLNGSSTGLESFVHPRHKVRAILREDEDRQTCGVMFQVDIHDCPASHVWAALQIGQMPLLLLLLL